MASDEMSLRELNGRFGRPGALRFESGPGGLAVAVLEAAGSRATVALLGATTLSYVPRGSDEILFVSDRSPFEPGKAIRGGIPLCFPWFGAAERAALGKDSGAAQAAGHAAGLPSHGFFRQSEWAVVGSESRGGETSLLLALASSEGTRRLWPHDFEADCRVSLGGGPSGTGLRVSLGLANAGGESFDLSFAFHPYFRIGELGRTRLPELAGASYVDFLAPPERGAEGVQEEEPGFGGRIDRQYRLTRPIALRDPVLRRAISVAGEATDSVVVWNPGPERCRAMPDLGREDWSSFLCVEPAVVPPASRRLAPGGRLEASIRIEAGGFPI